MPASTPLKSVPTDPATGAGGVVAHLVTDVVDAVFSPFAPTTTTPVPPVPAPAMWTLLAFARRDTEQGFATPASTTTPVSAHPTSEVVDSSRAAVAPVAMSSGDQALYTGEPSLIARVVELGLRVVDVALKPFGGILAFTNLSVPFVTDGIPPFFVTGGLDVNKSEFDGMPVWTLQPPNSTGQYVVALHGGAYTAQVSLFHWAMYADMARDTGATVIVPLYPLISQGGTAAVVVPQTADFIAQTINTYGAENVSVLGDSAGGGLAVAAVQELVRRGSPVPSRMVLLAPWLDATVSDPRSAAIDPDDSLLDVTSLQTDGRDWAGTLDPADPRVSPIYGSFAGLPPTAVFSGSLDLLTPDSLRLRHLALSQNLTNFTFDFRNGLIHDWPIFGFLPDAVAIRPNIYQALLGPRLANTQPDFRS